MKGFYFTQMSVDCIVQGLQELQSSHSHLNIIPILPNLTKPIALSTLLRKFSLS